MSDRIRRVDIDDDWADVAAQWTFDAGVIYLNHGSFGPPPQPVRDRRRHWQDRMDDEPMDFFYRQLEPALQQARGAIARFVGADPKCVALVENATYAMNVVANSFTLNPGDQVLLNNHEYGAVHRIWERKCRTCEAVVRSVKLPTCFTSIDQIIEPLINAMNDRTSLVVVSHVTSPTATIMPIEAIMAESHRRGIPVCIDGPHAVAQLPLNVTDLACDFYTASCHKWLCGGFGSGFVFAAERWHDAIRPPVLGWGRLLPARPQSWDEEFLWRGTRDISASMTLPAAIEFLEQVGLEAFRARSHYLSQLAAQRGRELLRTEPCAPPNRSWYGSMALIKLIDGDWSQLQQRLWQRHRIEVPIVFFENQWFVRVSTHLYTSTAHVDALIDGLREEVLQAGAK